MSYRADKPVIDTHTHGHTNTRTHRHTDGGNDYTRRPKLASGKNAVILTKFWSLAALEVVILTTSNAASDENLVKPFQWTSFVLLDLL